MRHIRVLLETTPRGMRVRITLIQCVQRNDHGETCSPLNGRTAGVQCVISAELYLPPSGRTAVMLDIPTHERIAAAYDAHYDVMRFIAAQRFSVPSADIQPLIHDVFVAFIRHHAAIADDRSWLVAAVSNACRKYWRDRKPTEELPETLVDPYRLADDVAARIDVVRLLRAIPRRCQTVLWLRYVEGRSPEEIATECGASSSSGYGRQLVHRCLRKLREALARREGDS